MRRAAGLAVVALVLVPAVAFGDVPYPKAPRGTNPYRYESYAFIADGDCSSGTNDEKGGLPPNFDCIGDWKYTNYAAQPGDEDFDPAVVGNPAELGGVKGARVNLAWEITTGRPDVVIAVLDSGIRWDGRESVSGKPDEGEINELLGLRKKFFLNRGELPRPGPSGCRRPGFGRYDRNCDGVFNIVDYERASGCRIHCVGDVNSNDVIDPEDLILEYSDGRDEDRNGYRDDISGWDFFEGDNDPNDDVDYGHGTGESQDSGFEAGAKDAEGNVLTDDGMCPNCMLLEMRVGDSFIADVNHWAEAVVYATDNGAGVVQEALGTLNNSAFGQAAADYAYRRGVVIVASAADESAAHHNYPSNYDHTMIVNSITRFNDTQTPLSYLYFNGCTNFGGHIHLGVSSSSCSSEATGRGSGYAGLLYSAARNAVKRGQITNYVRDDGRKAKFALSAEEAMQIFRQGAEDIDFSPPHSTSGYSTANATPTRRFQSVAGWDLFFGYGRINAYRMLVDAGFARRKRTPLPNKIPPEVDITSPAWFETLPPEGRVAIKGRAAANRSSEFTYILEWAPGAQDNPADAAEWTEVAKQKRSSAKNGVLGQLEMSDVAAAVESYAPTVFDPATDPTSPDLPERFSFRVRVTATDKEGNTGVFQKQLFVHRDDSSFANWPRQLGSDGAGAPAFVNLDGDEDDELLVSTSNGLIHAFNRDGSEVRGWPVHTRPIALPRSGRNAYTRGKIKTPIYAPVLLGSPAVGDVQVGDGGRLEIAAADLEGKVYLWNHDGSPVKGFPVSTFKRFWHEPGCHTGRAPICDDFLGRAGDRYLSARDQRDEHNSIDRGIHHTPVIADIDKAYRGLELIVGAGDNHLYAWHADGSRVQGWPVFLRDPTKVAAVNPRTHKLRYAKDASPLPGSKNLVSPSVGDVDGDGRLEIVATVNEEYAEEPNASRFREQLSSLLTSITDVGNGRVYLIDRRGSRAPKKEGAEESAHPHPQAFLPGWPVRIATLAAGILPYVGEGPDGAPVMADVDGDDDLEIGVAMHVGPGYIFDHDGSPHFGEDPEGRAITLSTSSDEFKGNAKDGPAFVAVGGGSFGELLPGQIAWTAPTGGLLRLLDVALAEQQLGAEDHVSAWEMSSGSFFPGFPSVVNDLQFFSVPTIADVSGDGVPEVIEGTAVYDVRAANALGTDVAGWPKFTGGWVVAPAATGDFDGDGTLDVASVTREGWLFVWKTEGDACQVAQWPKYQHDLANTGNYEAAGSPPAACPDQSRTIARKKNLRFAGLSASRLIR